MCVGGGGRLKFLYSLNFKGRDKTKEIPLYKCELGVSLYTQKATLSTKRMVFQAMLARDIQESGK